MTVFSPRRTYSVSGRFLHVEFRCHSVGLSIVTSVYCVKTAEVIKTSFGMVSGVSPRNLVLDGSAHWRHLENTFERLCAQLGLPPEVATQPVLQLFGKSCSI